MYETSSFAVTHTMRYGSPVLALGCSPDNTRLVVGLADCTLAVKQRLLQVAAVVSEQARGGAIGGEKGAPSMTPPPPPRLLQRSARVLRGGSYRYFLRGQATTASAEDVAVESGGAKQRLRAYDLALKRFEYGAALDSALATNNPSVVTRCATASLLPPSSPGLATSPRLRSLLEELVSRQGLVRALVGRAEGGTLEPLLAFLARHIADPRYASLLIDVSEGEQQRSSPSSSLPA